MPETVSALVAFLLLITPGLAFELLRERQRPQRDYTAFRETAIVVVSSVAFSGVALVVLLLVRWSNSNWLPDPVSLADNPNQYAKSHLGVVSLALVLWVGVATAAAWGWHRLLCWAKPGGRMSPFPAWFQITSGTANPSRDAPFVFVELDDGSTVAGLVKGYDLGEDHNLSSLVLCGDEWYPLRRRPPGAKAPQAVDGAWAYIVVSAERIRHLTVGYRRTEAALNRRGTIMARLANWLLSRSAAHHRN